MTFKEIKEDDMLAIEDMAKKYGVSVEAFGEILANSDSAFEPKQRQFRVTDGEYEIIVNKAKNMNMTIGSYCERACSIGLHEANNGAQIMIGKEYGAYRGGKRLAVYFKDVKLEKELVEFSNNFQISLGTVIRHFAINY